MRSIVEVFWLTSGQIRGHCPECGVSVLVDAGGRVVKPEEIDLEDLLDIECSVLGRLRMDGCDHVGLPRYRCGFVGCAAPPSRSEHGRRAHEAEHVAGGCTREELAMAAYLAALMWAHDMLDPDGAHVALCCPVNAQRVPS